MTWEQIQSWIDGLTDEQRVGEAEVLTDGKTLPISGCGIRYGDEDHPHLSARGEEQ